MLYMIVETFHPGKVPALYQRFEEKGRLLPEGVRYVNSWINEDVTRCYQVMECDDPALLQEWIRHWTDLASFEIIPVMTSAEAREKVKKAGQKHGAPHEYRTVVAWTRNGAVFTDNRYSRGHRWLFDGGVEVPASSSPHVVPLPLSVETAVDPEEAFVVSLSSCHMLWFLSLAARRGLVVESYRDEAIGMMGPDSFGKLAMTLVTLRPEVQFGGTRQPTADEVNSLHHQAHEECFLARSVKTEVQCQPVGLAT